jgi:molybdate transport system permease protein
MLSGEELQILGVSFGVALRGVLFALPLGLALATLLARARFRGKVLLDAVAHLPLALPPVLIGYFLLLALGRRGLIGHWLEAAFGVHLAFTANGAALATGVMILPLMIRAFRIAMEASDPGLLEAAALLGASPWDRFLSIALPLALPGLLAGLATAFAAALGEFGAVITFAGNIPGETQTLPLAIYAQLQSPGGDGAALRLAGISFACALAGLAGAEILQAWAIRRREG